MSTEQAGLLPCSNGAVIRLQFRGFHVGEEHVAILQVRTDWQVSTSASSP